MPTRRKFLRTSGALAAGAGLFYLGCDTAAEGSATNPSETAALAEEAKELFFKISLAQWSLNKQLFGGEMDNLDFARVAREDYGIEGIEYVNQFFKDKAQDMTYLRDLNQRAKDHGVTQVLIMIDGEGGLAQPDDNARAEAVQNHHKWVDAAAFLGCHSIRVNAYGEGSAEEVAKAAVDGLGTLATYAKSRDINVIVENHGGYSSNGAWLAGVMREIDMPNAGTLPDFGNFCITREEGNWRNCLESYDRYQGVAELMPYAKAVSAKANVFDEQGNEVESDYMRIMKTVKDAGYTGWVGIEYEGETLSAPEGIRATKALLERVGRELA